MRHRYMIVAEYRTPITTLGHERSPKGVEGLRGWRWRQKKLALKAADELLSNFAWQRRRHRTQGTLLVALRQSPIEVSWCIRP